MIQNFEFYDERARAAEDAAEQAQLENVRERELRSARAWRGMADRQLKIDAERIKADEARAVRRAEEAAALARIADTDEVSTHSSLRSPDSRATEFS